MVKFLNKRKNHLKSQVVIDQLFSSGKIISNPPFRLIFLEVKNSDFIGVQTLISVPKRRFKLAVTRNTIKRKISEAFRLNSLELNQKINTHKKHLALGIIYTGRKELEFSFIEKRIQLITADLIKTLKKLENEK